jgi:hypothetical protein
MKPSSLVLSDTPRVVVATAADLIYRVGCTVVGVERVATARDNAWAAVCEDRERAAERAEVARLLSEPAVRRGI